MMSVRRIMTSSTTLIQSTILFILAIGMQRMMSKILGGRRSDNIHSDNDDDKDNDYNGNDDGFLQMTGTDL
jgi:hypothetical protein